MNEYDILRARVEAVRDTLADLPADWRVDPWAVSRALTACMETPAGEAQAAVEAAVREPA